MVELRGISKYFSSNGVTALENADFSLRPAEIHALLGENGTGKSTLMHILAGYLSPSAGTILIDSKKRRFSSPADALALGIGMVRQHPGFIQGFKVWEDCILGAERAKPFLPEGKPGPEHKWGGLFFDPVLSKKRVEELSSQWNFNLPLDREAGTLTVSQRQKAAVLALLLRDIKWFIFDEPTAVLTPGETETLFELFRRLRSEGRGIAFITHKLDEALTIADRVTVIRRGVTQEPRDTKDLSAEDLRNSIFGVSGVSLAEAPSGEISFASVPVSPAPAAVGTEKPVLIIKDLLFQPPGLPYIWNVNLELKPGRILGIAGVRDSGLETLELALSGLTEDSGHSPGKFEGSITLNGHNITGKGVRAFRDAGGVYLGADRLGSNLAPELPLKESLIIHACRRAALKPSSLLGLLGFFDMNYLDSWCQKIMKRAGIKRSVSDRASSFSGGMLQRILLAREFEEDASLMVLAEAGSGLDQFSQAKLAEELRAHVNKGTAALLFSTDVEELISVADEIMVLRNGTFAARFILRPAVRQPESSGGEVTLSTAVLTAEINTAMTGTAGENDGP